jgi:hypothetical protein
MARLNDDAQWIVLMGFIVSFALFFLAIVVSQSTVVGQTTAEAVIEFPKNDIIDVRNEILLDSRINLINLTGVTNDIYSIGLARKMAIISFNVTPAPQGSSYQNVILIHYNNGVTAYNETANY